MKLPELQIDVAYLFANKSGEVAELTRFHDGSAAYFLRPMSAEFTNIPRMLGHLRLLNL